MAGGGVMLRTGVITADFGCVGGCISGEKNGGETVY